MSDVVGDALTWLETQSVAKRSRTVSYSRASDSVSVSGIPGKRNYEYTDEFGVIQDFEALDWMIRAGDLVLDGSAVTPTPGDQIRDTVGSDVRVYEVVEIPGGPAYDYSDNTLLRIHCKRVDTE